MNHKGINPIQENIYLWILLNMHIAQKELRENWLKVQGQGLDPKLKVKCFVE